MALHNLVPGDASRTMALDARGLSALKQQAKAAPGEALRAAAGQFEALFMQMLLKSMRDALPQEGPFASETTRTYTAMFDQQMAQQLAKKGVGIADMLVRQLSSRTAAPAATDGQTGPAPATGAGGGAGAVASGLPARAPSRAAAAAAVTPAAPPAAAAASGGLPASARAFLEKMRPHAEAAAQAAGIPAAFLLAQAALETGWGRHQPQAADGASSHNLFGIKAGSGWQGAKAVAATTEYVAGKAVTALETFRAYGSYTEAFQDFARLIRSSPRYAGVMAATGDAGAYAQKLQQSGYATDPRYAEKLARIIETVARHTSAGLPQVVGNAADKRYGAA
ncbi:MAG: flagellar assembly peptidoglycan hydrolase FlgJ [Betaproteobacteria bacterium]|nr:flagellar assembly peptidoglycan hydrolase FlgJ [Betaproteobacteria bacterium]